MFSKLLPLNLGQNYFYLCLYI